MKASHSLSEQERGWHSGHEGNWGLHEDWVSAVLATIETWWSHNIWCHWFSHVGKFWECSQFVGVHHAGIGGDGIWSFILVPWGHAAEVWINGGASCIVSNGACWSIHTAHSTHSTLTPHRRVGRRARWHHRWARWWLSWCVNGEEAECNNGQGGSHS